MTTVTYKVERSGDQWSVVCDGEQQGLYLTQEAAFETAAAYASGNLRTGHDIVIEARSPTDPAGAREQGGAPMRGDGFS
jgi:hypothetical protein